MAEYEAETESPPTLLARLGLYFAFVAFLFARHGDCLDLPPYEDQAVGAFAEADYLRQHQFNIFKLRYEENHFVDTPRGSRSYTVSVLPSVYGAVIALAPDVATAIHLLHAANLAAAAAIATLVTLLLRSRIGMAWGAVVALTVLATPLFSVQVEMIGMDIPATLMGLLSARAIWAGRPAAALLWQALAFLMKPAAVVFGLANITYLAIASIVAGVRPWGWSRRGAIQALLAQAILVGLEFAVFFWGDPVPELRQGVDQFSFPRSLRLPWAAWNFPDVTLVLGVSVALFVALTVASALARGKNRETGLAPWLARWAPRDPVVLYGLIYSLGALAAMSRWLAIARYVTSVVPFVWLAAASLALAPPLPRWAGKLAILAALLFGLANRDGHWFPDVAGWEAEIMAFDPNWHPRGCAYTERSGEYRDDHDAAIALVSLLQACPKEEPIYVGMPYFWYLTRPGLGYVKTPLANAVEITDFTSTLEAIVSAIEKSRRATPPGPGPVVVVTPWSRTLTPEPGDDTVVLFRDHLDPPLVAYRFRLDRLPADRRGLEDWYLDRTWGKSFLLKRWSDRSEFLFQTKRFERARRELGEVIAATPAADESRLANLRLQLADIDREEAASFGWRLMTEPGSQAKLQLIPHFSGGARVVIGHLGPGEEWRIHVERPLAGVEKGKTYRLGFRARASAPRSIAFAPRRAVAPWTPLAPYRTAALAQAWKPFEIEFVADATEKDVGAVFNVGQSVTPVDIADVKLEEVEKP